LQRVHLSIEVGEHANDYQQIAAKDKLGELQLRVRQLLDQVEQITKEQNYQRVCLPPPPFFLKLYINQ